MSRKPIKNYLRKHRLRAALSQREVSTLLGISKNTLSRYELGLRVPTAEVVIASALLFGVGGDMIFPQLYNSIEEDLPVRALAMQERLGDETGPAIEKKLALITGIPNRVR